VELVAGDSQFESGLVFDAIQGRKISSVIAWRRLKSRKNPMDVLSVKDRIDVEVPEHLRVVYKLLRAKSESLNGRVKARLSLWKVHVAGFVECLHPYVPRFLRGLRHLHSGCLFGETRPSVQYSLLCMRTGCETREEK
jgi:hypothetical protein